MFDILYAPDGAHRNGRTSYALSLKADMIFYVIVPPRRRKCRFCAFLLTEEKLLYVIAPPLPKKVSFAYAARL